MASGVLLSVIGAVQYGTSNVFFKVVPHFEAHDFRQFIHQIMQALGKFRLYFLPARAGHTLNPMEGFWRPTKGAIGSGRCFADIQGLYQRTRHVLLAHKEHPIFRFAW